MKLVIGSKLLIAFSIVFSIPSLAKDTKQEPVSLVDVEREAKRHCRKVKGRKKKNACRLQYVVDHAPATNASVRGRNGIGKPVQKDHYEKVIQQLEGPLNDIQNLIGKDEFTAAFHRSISLLDQTLNELGFDTRMELVDPIALKTFTWSQLNKEFHHLLWHEQQTIKRELLSLNEGFFLDLLNYSRRVRVLRVLSEYYHVKDLVQKRGQKGLSEATSSFMEDQVKSRLRRQVLEAMTYPIHLSTLPDMPYKIIFPEDILDEDYTFYSNLEIIVFALDLEFLGFSSPEEFIAETKKFRKELIVINQQNFADYGGTNISRARILSNEETCTVEIENNFPGLISAMGYLRQGLDDWKQHKVVFYTWKRYTRDHVCYPSSGSDCGGLVHGAHYNFCRLSPTKKACAWSKYISTGAIGAEKYKNDCGVEI